MRSTLKPVRNFLAEGGVGFEIDGEVKERLENRLESEEGAFESDGI